MWAREAAKRETKAKELAALGLPVEPAGDLEQAVRGADIISWYDSAEPLRSGWAWGQKVLENAAAVVDVSVGKGRVVLYGPEILFRSQPHGTYKLFFNGLFYGSLNNEK